MVGCTRHNATKMEKPVAAKMPVDKFDPDELNKQLEGYVSRAKTRDLHDILLRRRKKFIKQKRKIETIQQGKLEKDKRYKFELYRYVMAEKAKDPTSKIFDILTEPLAKGPPKSKGPSKLHKSSSQRGGQTTSRKDPAAARAAPLPPIEKMPTPMPTMMLQRPEQSSVVKSKKRNRMEDDSSTTTIVTQHHQQQEGHRKCVQSATRSKILGKETTDNPNRVAMTKDTLFQASSFKVDEDAGDIFMEADKDDRTVSLPHWVHNE